MAEDMKTLREALWRVVASESDVKLLHAALDELEALRSALDQSGALYRSLERDRNAALDELEALRGQAAYAESLDTENQRLRAEKAEAQRDELLACVQWLISGHDRDCQAPGPCTCGFQEWQARAEYLLKRRSQADLAAAMDRAKARGGA